MLKRLISLSISLAIACSMLFCMSFSAIAESGYATLYNKPFSPSDWKGSTAKITDKGLFSAVTSDGNVHYIQSKDKYWLGDDFVIDVKSYINNQNTSADKYSLIGVGNFYFIVRSYTVSGASSRTNHYYIMYNCPQANLYSTSTSYKFSALTDYIVSSSDDEVADGYSYKDSVSVKIVYNNGVLSFYADDSVVCELTADDVEAVDNTFTGFDFNDVNLGFRLHHTYKVHANGAYFSDLTVRCMPSPSTVTGLISNLPADITTDEASSVLMIRTLYDALSDSEKNQVDNIDTFIQAEVALTDAFIAALPDVVSSADGDDIDYCVWLYNKLSVEQQADLANYSKLERIVGEFSVIDIIESIDAIDEVTYFTVYDYIKINKKINSLSEAELGYVRNYSDYIQIKKTLSELKSELTSTDLFRDIVALPNVEFSADADEYAEQVMNIDLEYVEALELIRAKINVYGNHTDILNYDEFLDRELELYNAMLAFNEIADSKLHVARYSYYEGVSEGEYCSFDADTVVYEGDTVHIMGIYGCNGVSPTGFTYYTLYNVAYAYNGVIIGSSYQPVNGACPLRDLKAGTYTIYHRTYDSVHPDYELFSFTVLPRPTYNYEVFDIATMIDHTVVSYDDVKYSDKEDVERIWELYDSLSVFDIDRVHNVRNLVTADVYFADVDSGIIEEEPEDELSVLLGDVNLDQTIDSADLLLISQYLIGANELSDVQILAANIDQSSGSISSTDYLRLAMYLLGLRSSL